MLLDCKKGRYIVDTNFRDAFRLDVFEEKYIEECFDKYIYIVGDISAGILRLKGFDTNPKSKNYYGKEGVSVSCVFTFTESDIKKDGTVNYKNSADGILNINNKYYTAMGETGDFIITGKISGLNRITVSSAKNDSEKFHQT